MINDQECIKGMEGILCDTMKANSKHLQPHDLRVALWLIPDLQ